MEKGVNIKTVVYRALAMALPFMLLYFISITKKSFPEKSASESHAFRSAIYQVTLRDTLPEECVVAMGAVEKKGIMIKSPSGIFTAFYEYEADQDIVLQEISKLSFLRDNNISDLSCHPIEAWQALHVNSLTKKEIAATSFFFKCDADQYVAFECRKSPMKHTLLLDTHSKRILHKVEMI